MPKPKLTALLVYISKHPASRAHKKSHRMLYAGCEDADPAVALEKAKALATKAVAERVAGPTTYAWIVDKDKMATVSEDAEPAGESAQLDVLHSLSHETVEETVPPTAAEARLAELNAEIAEINAAVKAGAASQSATQGGVPAK